MSESAREHPMYGCDPDRILPLLKLGGIAFLACVAASVRAEPAPVSTQNVLPVQSHEAVRQPQLYVIRYRPGPNYDTKRPLLKQDLSAHGKFIADLVRKRVIIAAGPTLDQPGGLVLLRARDLAAARTHMLDDPAVAAGIFVGEISDWRPAFDPDKLFAPR